MYVPSFNDGERKHYYYAMYINMYEKDFIYLNKRIAVTINYGINIYFLIILYST